MPGDPGHGVSSLLLCPQLLAGHWAQKERTVRKQRGAGETAPCPHSSHSGAQLAKQIVLKRLIFRIKKEGLQNAYLQMSFF